MTPSPRTAGHHQYELTNHLGNVSVIVSDNKLLSANQSQKLYLPDVLEYQDYYPFGMVMNERKGSYTNRDYRYGYNGKENDNEVKGESNQQDYGFRVYDPRVGRFLSVDPLTQGYPFYSPYQFAGNKPIRSLDLDGAEEFDFMVWLKDLIFGEATIHTKGNKSEVDKRQREDNIMIAKAGLDAIVEVSEAYDQVYGSILPGYSSAFSASKGNYIEAAVLAVLDVGTAGKGKVSKKAVKEACEEVCKEGSKTLYRAIGIEEFKDIVEKRALNNPYGIDSKYFAQTVEDAITQGLIHPKNKDNFMVIGIEVPKNVLDKMD